MSHDPIAYVYNAAYHCPDCAGKAGMDVDGAEDREGPVAVLPPWGEWTTEENDTLECDTCGDVIDERGEGRQAT